MEICNGKKIEARYYWSHVLSLKDVEKDLKNNVKNKLKINTKINLIATKLSNYILFFFKLKKILFQ
mgnify:CR=1 FL=1